MLHENGRCYTDVNYDSLGGRFVAPVNSREMSLTPPPQTGDTARVKDILKAPVLGFEDVDANDALGYQTPLQWAADGGFTKICVYLIEGGADPDASGAHPDDFTPMHLAALNGNAEVVQV